MSILSRLIEDTIAMPGKFAEVAGHDPIAAVLLLIGAVLVLFSSAVFGILSLGAVVDLIFPGSRGETHPPDR